MKFNKIWLTKRWLWRCNVFMNNWKDKYAEFTDIKLMDLIEKIKKSEYNWDITSFDWYKNL